MLLHDFGTMKQHIILLLGRNSPARTSLIGLPRGFNQLGNTEKTVSKRKNVLSIKVLPSYNLQNF